MFFLTLHVRNVRQSLGVPEPVLVNFFVRCIGANFSEGVSTHVPFSAANGIDLTCGRVPVHADGLGEI